MTSPVEGARAVEREDPPLHATELEMLSAFLDHYRATILTKVEGLTQAQLAHAHPPSTLTLGGLLKHLAFVEESWFEEDLLGWPRREPFVDVDWDADPDWEFRTAADDTPEWLVARYEEACARSRAVVAQVGDLDAESVAFSRRRPDEHFTLRWILVHMIEETARHAGHADLIREAVDGVTGD